MAIEGHRVITLAEPLLAQNEKIAMELRSRFTAKGVRVLNIVSSPGAGKTALLERTLTDLAGTVNIAVIVGDLETANDAKRMQNKGAQIVQIVTGDVCHLDASMVQRALIQIDQANLQLLIIENVGNLVCPASYDLGEDTRVVLHSVTEGEDKPLKYPTIFKNADIVLVTKMDIAEAVEFDRETALSNIHQVAPQAETLELSSRSGIGMDAWYQRILPTSVK